MINVHRLEDGGAEPFNYYLLGQLAEVKRGMERVIPLRITHHHP